MPKWQVINCVAILNPKLPSPLYCNLLHNGLIFIQPFFLFLYTRLD